MKNRVIVMYPKPSEEGILIVDGAREQNEKRIIDHVCGITGMQRKSVARILKRCKKFIANDAYPVDDLEDRVLAAIERIRRMGIHETV